MTKLLVLGGGPAGYVAAGRAAQLGAEVTLVEAREIGGTCLNRGCIPTKAMVAGAQRLHAAREAGAFGVQTGPVSLDFPAFMARKDAVTAQLRDGVAHLLKARKVEVVAGRAALAGPGRLRLGDGRELAGDAVILASGSEPVRMGLFDWSDPRLMTSDELLAIDHVPESLLIVGGGVIGCEFASVFARLGTAVTVVEMLDQLLPGEDKRTGRTLQQAFKKNGIAVHVKTAVEAAAGSEAGVTVSLGGGRELTAARVLVAVGRRPLSAGMGYAEAGVELDARGFVVTDETCRTTARRRLRGRRRGGPAAPRALGLPPGHDRRRERRHRDGHRVRPRRSSRAASSAPPRSRHAGSPRTPLRRREWRTRSPRCASTAIPRPSSRASPTASCASSASRAAAGCSAPASSGRTSPSSCTSSPWRCTPASRWPTWPPPSTLTRRCPRR